ncbi:hypothetical protein CRG98_038566 [Punica granatum]|uniref:Uncharacterized protein n=1 Tax=Punica granatum TaxID=22663 RepID=A0A2I0IAK3_PUNGR|nr:hypothetical protein CRG98_038566 [Punica granatum]
MAKSQTSSGTDGKLRQPSILDMFKKAGAVTSQELPNEDSASPSSKTGTSESADQNPSDYNETELDVSAATKTFDLQRFKFRPLHLHCYSILTFSKLPLYLYLLRDLQYKLDIFTISGKESIAAPDYAGTTLHEFFKTIKPLFPTLKKHLDNAIRILREGDESCQAHWEMQSVAAGNPSFPSAILSKTSSSSSFIKEALHLFFKMLNLPNIQTDANLLSDLLSAFQPNVVPDNAFSGVEPCPLPNSIEYLYHGAYSYLENFLDMEYSLCFMVTSEALLTLESLSSLPQKLTRKPGENGKNLKLGFPESVLLNLRRRLGVSAEKLLKSHWDAKNTEDGLKSKASYGTADEEVHHGFATLCPATYLVWYRVLVKDVLSGKPIATIGSESTKELLLKLQLSVNVMVSLVNMCRTHDKVTLHAMAVKYGGKFIESFLKGNLKHKDLTGQVVSSQAYLDEQSGNADEEDSREVAEDDENSIPNNDDDKETE